LCGREKGEGKNKMDQKAAGALQRLSATKQNRRCWAITLALACFTFHGAIAAPLNENSTAVLQQPSSPFRVTIIDENPALALFGRDRHYTNGFKLALTSCQLADEGPWNAPVRLLRLASVFPATGPGTDTRLEWTPVAQSIFTAQDHTHRFADPNDRPFAGWLYAGFEWIQNDDDRVLTSFEVQGGIVGPWAIGRQVENTFHDLVNIERVRAWQFQLSNEFGAVVWSLANSKAEPWLP
jgi:lipid A 3-O-deacylase